MARNPTPDPRHIVRARAPDGAESFVCYAAPGLTPDRRAATRFNSREIAARVARSERWGEPAAFWESERRSAAATRAARKGWEFSVEPVTPPALGVGQ